MTDTRPMVSKDAEQQLREALLARVNHVLVGNLPFPPLRSTIQALRAQGQQYRQPAQLAQLVKSDPILAALCLRAINQEALLEGSCVRSLEVAVAHLGSERVHRLVGSARKPIENAESLDALRGLVTSHALRRAEIAATIAENFSYWPDDAYTAALLADLGSLVALTCLEDILSQHPEVHVSPARCLRLARAFNADVLARFGPAWLLPAEIAEIARGARPSHFSSLGGLLEVADNIASRADGAQDGTGELEEAALLVEPSARGAVQACLRRSMALAPKSDALLQRRLPSPDATWNGLGSGVESTRVSLFDAHRDLLYVSKHMSKERVVARTQSRQARASAGEVLHLEMRYGDAARWLYFVVQAVERSAGTLQLELAYLPVHSTGDRFWKAAWQSLRSAPQARGAMGDISQAFAAICLDEDGDSEETTKPFHRLRPVADFSEDDPSRNETDESEQISEMHAEKTLARPRIVESPSTDVFVDPSVVSGSITTDAPLPRRTATAKSALTENAQNTHSERISDETTNSTENNKRLVV